MSRIEKNGLQIEPVLYDFLVKEALPGSGIDADTFFAGFSKIVHDLAPKNRELLAKRDRMQAALDDWYRKNGAPVDIAVYEASRSRPPMLIRKSLILPARSSSFPS